MYVGKIKYRDQHRAEDRASTSDRGGGAEHMTNTLDRGVLRRSDHAEDRANTLDRGGGAEHMTDMLRRGAKPPQIEFAAQMSNSVHRTLRGATRWCATL